MPSRLKRVFTADYERYEGVPPINIYVMRLVYALMLMFLGKDSWTYIFAHRGQWEPLDAMAWSVWAAFATLGLIGLFHTVRMIPLLLFEIFYKVLWLYLVAYPLWMNHTLAGSEAEGMTYAFAWVVLPIIAMPWPYIFRTYLVGRSATTARA
jgi:hypothetical protein